MTKISIAFLAALSLAGLGCHKDQRDANKAAAVAKLNELKNKMCACTSKTCSDQVSNEYSRWNQEQSKTDSVEGPAGEQDKRMEELTEQMTQCLLKLEVPSGGTAGAAGSAARAEGAGADGSAGGATGSGSAAAGSAQ